MAGAHERGCRWARRKPAYHGRELGELGCGGCVVTVELNYVATTAAAAGVRKTVPSNASIILRKTNDGGIRKVEDGYEGTAAQRTGQHRGHKSIHPKYEVSQLERRYQGAFSSKQNHAPFFV